MTRAAILLAVLVLVYSGCDPSNERLLIQCDRFCQRAGARIEVFAAGAVCHCVWPEKPCQPADAGVGSAR
jgi:hypothetical protein